MFGIIHSSFIPSTPRAEWYGRRFTLPFVKPQLVDDKLRRPFDSNTQYTWGFPEKDDTVPSWTLGPLTVLMALVMAYFEIRLRRLPAPICAVPGH